LETHRARYVESVVSRSIHLQYGVLDTDHDDDLHDI